MGRGEERGERVRRYIPDATVDRGNAPDVGARHLERVKGFARKYLGKNAFRISGAGE